MRGPNPKTTTRARQLRRDATQAENKLWYHLNNRQLDGLKFVRQHPIGPYFTDFACRSEKLVVEIDGATHETAEELAYDERRTVFLQERGYRVIRFRNDEIYGDLGPVLEVIRRAVKKL